MDLKRFNLEDFNDKSHIITGNGVAIRIVSTIGIGEYSVIAQSVYHRCLGCFNTKGEREGNLGWTDNLFFREE